MAISPWFQGDTATWSLQIVPDTGYLSIANLAPANFSLIIRNTDISSEQAGTGVFSALTAAVINADGSVRTPTTISYTPSVADVSTLGNFHLYGKVALPSGTETIDWGAWQVVSS